MIRVERVTSPKQWKAFIELPWKIYEGDPNWVPPIRRQVRDLLDAKKNPFFAHARAVPFLAWRGGKLVGRIVGVVDENFNQFQGVKQGFFGFFECFDDPEAAQALLSEVAAWARARGVSSLAGPVNLSTNNECGLLVDGFGDPPSVMMTYNPEYYRALIEGAGLKKAKDLYAWELSTQDTKFGERILSHARKVKESAGVRVRPANMKDFDGEITKVLEIFNDAWEKNWGFVPMEEAEMRRMAAELKLVLDPELLLFAEVNGAPAAFALALPDVNQALRKNRSGKLTPWSLARLLWDLKGPGRKKTIDRLRIITLGVKKAFRPMGLGPILYAEYLTRGLKAGYRRGEASWILEDNQPMNGALVAMSAKKTKTYRIYEKAI